MKVSMFESLMRTLHVNIGVPLDYNTILRFTFFFSFVASPNIVQGVPNSLDKLELLCNFESFFAIPYFFFDLLHGRILGIIH